MDNSKRTFEVNKKCGQILYECLKERKLSQKDFSKIAWIKTQNLNKYIKGKNNWTSDKAMQFADALSSFDAEKNGVSIKEWNSKGLNIDYRYLLGETDLETVDMNSYDAIHQEVYKQIREENIASMKASEKWQAFFHFGLDIPLEFYKNELSERYEVLIDGELFLFETKMIDLHVTLISNMIDEIKKSMKSNHIHS